MNLRLLQNESFLNDHRHIFMYICIITPRNVSSIHLKCHFIKVRAARCIQNEVKRKSKKKRIQIDKNVFRKCEIFI